MSKIVGNTCKTSTLTQDSACLQKSARIRTVCCKGGVTRYIYAPDIYMPQIYKCPPQQCADNISGWSHPLSSLSLYISDDYSLTFSRYQCLLCTYSTVIILTLKPHFLPSCAWFVSKIVKKSRISAPCFASLNSKKFALFMDCWKAYPPFNSNVRNM